VDATRRSEGAVTSARRTPLPISVIVPTRNAADWIVECLTAIRANNPAEIIVVDGYSSDGTAALAGPLATRLIREATEGPAAARNIGGDAAAKSWLAFIDADIVIPDGSLAALLGEAKTAKLGAIQAGLRSSGTEYWSDQLAWHHNAGRSRSWFGVSATLMKRQVFRAHRFDDRLVSGEDVDIRMRLEAAGVPVAVSESTIVDHRFAPGFTAAREQWLADGAGLGRIVRKFGRDAFRQLAVPFAAAAYWISRSLVAPRRLPYFAGFAVGNWLGALTGIGDRRVEPQTADGARATTIARLALILGGLVVAAVLISAAALVVIALTVARSAIVNSAFVPILAVGAIAILIVLQVAETLPPDHPKRLRIGRHRRAITILVAATIVLAALRLLGTLRLLN
jgi:glycosyltransferase involved in cell wall biosynthesis